MTFQIVVILSGKSDLNTEVVCKIRPTKGTSTVSIIRTWNISEFL